MRKTGTEALASKIQNEKFFRRRWRRTKNRHETTDINSCWSYLIVFVLFDSSSQLASKLSPATDVFSICVGRRKMEEISYSIKHLQNKVKKNAKKAHLEQGTNATTVADDIQKGTSLLLIMLLFHLARQRCDMRMQMMTFFLTKSQR